MKINGKLAAATLAAALLLSGCGEAAPAASATPTAAPTAAPTAEATPTPAPEPETSVDTSATPAPEDETDLTGDLESMTPLLEAHALALLNGGSFSADDSTYVWQTICFAIDGCGLDFYSGETLDGALSLSRGVVEEIASGLFSTLDALPEIPEALENEIWYDAESDSYARYTLDESGFSLALTTTAADNGSVTVLGALSGAGMGNIAATLVPNTRAGNSLFTYSVEKAEIVVAND